MLTSTAEGVDVRETICGSKFTDAWERLKFKIRSLLRSKFFVLRLDLEDFALLKVLLSFFSRYLQGKFAFIDSGNTGIWGWSYGGFSTAWVLVKDVGNVFKCGLSVAPVTSFIYYGKEHVLINIRHSFL